MFLEKNLIVARFQDYLVSFADGIEGTRLFSTSPYNPERNCPSCYYPHIHRVEEFLCQAKIPVKHQQDSINKLEQLFREWQGLKKNKSHQTST